MASRKPNVLVVLTSHTPGWYLPELAHPFEVLGPHCDITLASHAGGEAPLDSSSVTAFKDDEISTKFLNEQELLWKNTRPLGDFVGRTDQFDAIFYVGGFGPMFDLVQSEASAAVIGEFHAKNKLISAVCHGSATLAHLKVPGTNTNMLEGHRVTGISNKELEMISADVVEPFSVEDELNKASGGKYEKADEPFAGWVVISKGPDGRTIITGQNPASGTALGKAIYEELFGRPYSG
ncbi:MAG: hypothetical protein Q9217_004415 [Psora testacea]